MSEVIGIGRKHTDLTSAKSLSEVDENMVLSVVGDIMENLGKQLGSDCVDV